MPLTCATSDATTGDTTNRPSCEKAFVPSDIEKDGCRYVKF